MFNSTHNATQNQYLFTRLILMSLKINAASTNIFKYCLYGSLCVILCICPYGHTMQRCLFIYESNVYWTVHHCNS